MHVLLQYLVFKSLGIFHLLIFSVFSHLTIYVYEHYFMFHVSLLAHVSAPESNLMCIVRSVSHLFVTLILSLKQPRSLR